MLLTRLFSGVIEATDEKYAAARGWIDNVATIRFQLPADVVPTPKRLEECLAEGQQIPILQRAEVKRRQYLIFALF